MAKIDVHGELIVREGVFSKKEFRTDTRESCGGQGEDEHMFRWIALSLQLKTNGMNKERFLNLLRSTGRNGIEAVIDKLEELGFFSAPASTRFHLSCEGGLLEHSLNVYDAAMMVRERIVQRNPELEEQLPVNSVILCTLLHDTCKSDIYKSAIVSRKNDAGYWEKCPGYQVDYSGLPLGHGEKSVIMLLSWGLELTPEEMLAIRWHMTAWDLPFQNPEHKESLSAARAKTPLCSLVQVGDSIATGLMER